MELKEWDKYTQEEKESLLMHAFYYYGKLMFSLAELEDFQKLCHERADDVLIAMSAGFVINQGGPTLILKAMRSKSEKKLLDYHQTASKEEKAAFKKCSEYILQDIVRTYNNPEPDIPLSPEQLKDSIDGLKGRQ